MAAVLLRQEARLRWRSVLARQGGAIALAGLAAWALRDRLLAIDVAAVAGALATVPATGWLAAIALTAVSFAAIGRYDAAVHDLLGTGCARRPAERAGMAAIAVAQTTGLGLISGSLVRWRLLPQLGLAGAGRVTVTVTASFLAAWAMMTALAVAAFAPMPVPVRAAAGLAGAGALAALVLAAPRLKVLPSRRWMMRVLVWTMVDVTAAAAALWVLVPGPIDFGMLLPAYLLALGAGLVMGTPAGIGPFELVLIALMPDGDGAQLLAAALAFRMVYYALPAVAATGLLLRGPLAEAAVAPCGPVTGPDLARATRAEAGLARQGHLGLLGAAGWLVGQAGPMLVAMGDPLAGADAARLPARLETIAARARADARLPCLYKVSARTAAAARAAGWHAWHVADEMTLDPRRFDTAGPERAGLRRKLRHAERAGLSVSLHAPDSLDPGMPLMQVLDRIARDWARRHHAERGFSMGRFAPAYLAGQRVCIAWQQQRPVGFASFHQTGTEWALDLMRVDGTAPDGTMHALVASAITEAARLGLPRLSLAAVPAAISGAGAGLAARLPASLHSRLSAPGLRQFKRVFTTRAEPRYLVAPSRVALACAAASLAWAIHRPARLARPEPPAAPPAARPGAGRRDAHPTVRS